MVPTQDTEPVQRDPLVQRLRDIYEAEGVSIEGERFDSPVDASTLSLFNMGENVIITFRDGASKDRFEFTLKTNGQVELAYSNDPQESLRQHLITILDVFFPPQLDPKQVQADVKNLTNETRQKINFPLC